VTTKRLGPSVDGHSKSSAAGADSVPARMANFKNSMGMENCEEVKMEPMAVDSEVNPTDR